MKKQAALLAGIFLFMVLAGATGEKSTPGQVTPQVPAAPAAASIKADLDFGRVPLYFIPNEGQMDGRVAFCLQGRDKSVYFTPGGVTFLLSQPEAEAARTDTNAFLNGTALEEISASKSWVVKLDFVGGNSELKPVGENATGGVVSYFKGKPADWKAGLPTYSRIVYRELWPGIDLAYSGTVNRLKYEFIVHPGADPAQIRLAYRGVNGLSVDEDGRLEMKTPAGAFKDDTPIAYQETGGARKAVSLSYKLEAQEPDGKGEVRPRSAKEAGAGACRYGFEVGDYDPTRPLILDPSLLIFSGYIGGNSDDEGCGIAVDDLGNVYVTGFTNSSETTFPETVGPDLGANGSYDAFVAKVDASGTALVYCGYIGGADDDRGNGIAIDSSGSAYITGYTLSTQASFPVIAGYDLTHNGLKDAFIAKVNASGSALTYCTYVGGSADDIGYGIAVDGSGNVYIGGSAGSSEATFPEITGPDLTFNGGNNDAFICKLNSTGTGRYYCGYIGGSGDDYARAIAVDSSGNVFITGGTFSNQSTFPVSVGPDLTYYGGEDGFVAKVNSSGVGLAYCGYIGGDGYTDCGNSIVVDSKGSAYIAGQTSSQTNFPVVVGPDLTFNGWGYIDAFVAKVSPGGDAFVYCGYIGSSGMDEGWGIAVDPSGSAYVTGLSGSYGPEPFPIVDAFDTTHEGNMEGFVAKVSPSGAKLTYSSYLGGSGWDRGSAVAADRRGNAYLTGWTAGAFPVAVGPDLSHNGSYDVFVAKVYHYYAPGPKKTAVGDFDGDGTKELAVDMGTNGAWIWDGGSWSQLSAMDPEGMIEANVDGDPAAELLIEFGYSGLWLYNNGAMNLLSEADVERMVAGDIDNDLNDEVAVDFGTTGFWLFDEGSWNQLSGANLDTMILVNLDGYGGDEIVADFGAIGLWEYVSGGWTQLSGVNVENMAGPDIDGAGGHELMGDFGPVGLWLFMAGDWTALSIVNVDYMIEADVDHSGTDALVGDFSGTGLWLYDDVAGWEILSGLDAEYMVAADTDYDAAKELAADFGPLGLWLWDGGSWSQISGVDPENLTAGDIDGDNAEEIVADFGTLGLWLWNGGVWSQISALNPD